MNPDDDRGVTGFYVEEEKNLRKCIQSDHIASKVLDIVEDALVA